MAALKEDANKIREKKKAPVGAQSSNPPPSRPVPQGVPLSRGQSSRTPQSSSEVTLIGLRLLTIKDLSFLNRNLYRNNIKGEEQTNLPYLRLRDFIEELR